MQLDNHCNFSKAMQIAIAAYQMVSNQSIGFSLFYLLYRCKPLMLKEIHFTKYNSDEDYKVAVSSHIEHMISINEQAI